MLFRYDCRERGPTNNFPNEPYQHRPEIKMYPFYGTFLPCNNSSE
jgi:hypothetical protein